MQLTKLNNFRSRLVEPFDMNYDDDSNSATMELDLNLSNTDDNIPPPGNDVGIRDIRGEGRRVVLVETVTMDRPIGKVHVNQNRNSRMIGKSVGRKDARPERIKCLYPNCMTTFTQHGNMIRHMKNFHSKNIRLHNSF